MEVGNEQAGAPKKPSLARQVAPWLFAAGILAFMLYKVDFRKVGEALAGARASWIVAAFLTYCAVYYLTDVLSFYRSYNWFNVEISLGETARLRFASYTVQAVNGALTEIMSVLYMFRVKKTPVLEVSSSAGFVYFNETVTLVALLSFCAFLLPEQNRIRASVPWIGVQYWSVFQGLIILAWAVVPLWLAFWRTGLRDRWPRWRDASVLTAFKQATIANYGEVFLYRFSNNLISVVANIVMLKALGIAAPAALMFAAVPVMVNVAYWPVSAGGFGGPQLVAHFLLKGYATEEQVLAYSLIWSALFFLTRVFSGLPLLAPVYRAAFPARREA
ncbi:MAG TPA: lysylphosphatidylglycerol synthase domain-containing protein [bacterium]|nr:lysylphosphatidylglycerol synthase domain-containing protein [bacterium]